MPQVQFAKQQEIFCPNVLIWSDFFFFQKDIAILFFSTNSDDQNESGGAEEGCAETGGPAMVE